LKLIGAYEKSIRIGLDFLGNITAGKTIKRCLAHFRATVFVLTGKCDDSLIRALPFHEVRFNSMIVLDRASIPLVTTIARA